MSNHFRDQRREYAGIAAGGNMRNENSGGRREYAGIGAGANMRRAESGAVENEVTYPIECTSVCCYEHKLVK